MKAIALHRDPARHELADSGALKVEIEREFPLAKAAEEHRLIEAGHVRGTLVRTV